MSDMKAKEVNQFVRKAHRKSSPSNNGVSYKVWKNCPLLRNTFFTLSRIREKEDRSKTMVISRHLLNKGREFRGFRATSTNIARKHRR